MTSPQNSSRRMLSKLCSVLLAAGVVAISAAALEGLVRIYFGYPLLSMQDWRASLITPIALRLVKYHPDLGWTLVPNTSVPEVKVNTFELGLRKNRREAESVSTGAILAVGDSFTAGSEVYDWETWPAQLEALLKRRVLNAGVGGYGVDQIVMNAERLAPIVKPSVLIVGLLDQDILRNAYAVYGAPKPYFQLDGGVWHLRNSPVPPPALKDTDTSIKTALAQSATMHLFATALARDWWLSDASPKSEFVKIDQGASPGQSACHLLLRLADKMKGVRLIMTMQYGGPFFASRQARGPHAEEVLQCVAGRYEIVDEYDTLRAIAERSLDELKTLYVIQPDGISMGHMSAKGNAVMANLLRQQLLSKPASLPPQIDVSQ